MQPKPSQQIRPRDLVAFIGVALIVGVSWLAYDSYQRDKARQDREACERNLAYYERICAANPASCPEGPRRLARCAP